MACLDYQSNGVTKLISIGVFSKLEIERIPQAVINPVNPTMNEVIAYENIEL